MSLYSAAEQEQVSVAIKLLKQRRDIKQRRRGRLSVRSAEQYGVHTEEDTCLRSNGAEQTAKTTKTI
ncbi:hypothetical protein Q7C36_000197 [Tachysurus vachellii]|uniref:Uncharacterized protein n=1 Tax=Tachysurus vachellii TaxID=175792 RepID=A0AA88TIG9_TACVA|nr:hypothetical protein Q7C36_000197 [Tachysurus vachellii]